MQSSREQGVKTVPRGPCLKSFTNTRKDGVIGVVGELYYDRTGSRSYRTS